MLQLLLPFQILFIPGLILLLLWSVYRTVIKKDYAVGLVLYLGLVIIVDSFLNTGIYIPGLDQGSIKYSEIVAYFLIASNPKVWTQKRSGGAIILFVFLYFLLMAVSSLRGYTLWDGVYSYRRYLLPQILAFLLAYRGLDSKEDHGAAVFLFLTLLIIISLVTFWDVFFDRSLLKSDMLFKPEYWHNRKVGRFGSFFLNPNHMATFAVLVFPVVFLWTLRETEFWKRIYCWASLLALSFALIETKSRGPLLGFTVAFIFLIAVPTGGFSFIRKAGYTMLFLSVLYLFMPGFFDHATERFETIGSEATEDSISRSSIWPFTQKIISEYPLLGIGLGEKQYIEYMERFGFREEYGSMPLDNPHNSYLQIAVHAGIPALFAYILLNGALIKKGISFIFKYRGSRSSLYVTGLLAGIVGFLTCITVDMQLFTENVASVYWAAAGLLSSMIHSENTPEQT